MFMVLQYGTDDKTFLYKLGSHLLELRETEKDACI